VLFRLHIIDGRQRTLSSAFELADGNFNLTANPYQPTSVRPLTARFVVYEQTAKSGDVSCQVHHVTPSQVFVVCLQTANTYPLPSACPPADDIMTKWSPSCWQIACWAPCVPFAGRKQTEKAFGVRWQTAKCMYFVFFFYFLAIPAF